MEPTRLSDRLKVFLQSLVPQHALSRLMGALSRAKAGRLLVGAVVRVFSKIYRVDLDEAVVPEEGFESFDAFFTRPLRDGARRIEAEPAAIVSPVDGTLSAAGAIEGGRLLQAKGKYYTVAELLGSEEKAARYEGGTFATLYLSPRDYHRIHAPCAGAARELVYLPGALFSVNPATVRARRGLFSRNERVAVHFDGTSGPFALVLVGALIVGSIEIAWQGVVAPGPGGRKPLAVSYEGADAPVLGKGAELGRFHLGSTVIVLVPPRTGRLDALAPERAVRLGERIGALNRID